MAPDLEQLHRVRALAVRAGLALRPVDAEEFVATYEPHRYRQFVLPPSFVWLCTICEPAQLARIFIDAAAPGDLTRLRQLNDDTRIEVTVWPDELVAFARTGDESFCFAYNTPDEEPAVVTVDSYRPCREDENDEPYVDWSASADHFEHWLSRMAHWLPEADAKLAAWNSRSDQGRRS